MYMPPINFLKTTHIKGIYPLMKFSITVTNLTQVASKDALMAKTKISMCGRTSSETRYEVSTSRPPDIVHHLTAHCPPTGHGLRNVLSLWEM